MSPLKQPKLQRHLFLFSIDFKGCTWVSADFRHWSFSFFLSRSRQTSFPFKGIPCFKVDIQTPRPEMKTFWLSQQISQSNFESKLVFNWYLHCRTLVAALAAWLTYSKRPEIGPWQCLWHCLHRHQCCYCNIEADLDHENRERKNITVHWSRDGQTKWSKCLRLNYDSEATCLLDWLLLATQEWREHF